MSSTLHSKNTGTRSHAIHRHRGRLMGYEVIGPFFVLVPAFAIARASDCGPRLPGLSARL